MSDWKAVRRIIARGRRFVVTTHLYPDGDAVGSSIALLRLLRAMGKSAGALLPSPVPAMYRFLRGESWLRTYRRTHEKLLSSADVIFILDSSTNDRLGALYETMQQIESTRICIDHHPNNSVSAELKVIDTRACSTAQMVYDLFHACGLKIDTHTAEALYTGIHTDTVSFNFLGTTARTHEIAADLLAKGVDAKRAWTKIYRNDTPGLLKLAGLVLSGLHTADRGRIAWTTVTRKQWQRLRVNPRDTESFTRYPLTLHKVGVIAFFCEEAERRVRVSLRALDKTDVGRIARAFGGGGHQTSSGVTMREPLSRAIAMIIRAIERGK
ncbi:MAG: bifunctional oligoribonuclease/PAP phosphatase NrnA [Candidatus Aureabacteria bacterium]|nr:bifunctional oligoribonuclease/PAP phosphatase NrnA [Candidatus Auribacterota bacterium]